MIKNYFKTAWRNLVKNRSYGLINIFGLTMGLAVVLLIALWIWDEMSFDRYFKNHKRIALVLQQHTKDDVTYTDWALPMPLADALRKDYGAAFEGISLLYSGVYNLTFAEKKLSAKGTFMEPDGPSMFSLELLSGDKNALKDPASVLLSQSLARTLFGNGDPLNQVIRITNQFNVKVAGVYKDLPKNTSLSEDAEFIAPWQFGVSNWEWIKKERENWDYNLFKLAVQLAPHTRMEDVSARIRKVLAAHVTKAPGEQVVTNLSLYPMSRWHLYDFDKRGALIPGNLQYIWLFGTIGFFVLLLACINFMNLSTARSIKRAREVGIRKTIGSRRVQLILQFFGESVLTTLISFLVAVVIVQLALSWFNTLTNKNISVHWFSGWFWLSGLLICMVTGLLAGSYPAFYLSSFKPVNVLKGLFKGGAGANIPRKVLVVLQFTISIFLIIGTTVIYRQIQYAKSRPVGYNRDGLLSVQMTTPEIYARTPQIRNELLASGAVQEMALSQCPVTEIWAGDNGFNWKGKAPSTDGSFAVVAASIEFGKMAGWQFVEGRGFSKEFPTDSSGLVITESAAAYMGIRHPSGTVITWHGKNYTILGVVKNVMMTSPFGDDSRIIFPLLREPGNFMILRMNPGRPLSESMKTIAAIFQKHNPFAPFEYSFVDEAYAKKFVNEERIGKLATLFSVLAIFISLLGLFGIASFMTEQRTKEIGIRKVLGAPVTGLWNLLSKELILLVVIAIAVAIPAGYYAMNGWLYRYDYRINISWPLFLLPALASLLIAFCTISLQIVRAIRANPVHSLRSE
ncbi:ABC transporter permease [Niabella pedocola]|uniref:ABC transporter permease n=1 Tax=Niabella pedocola TaxID=1752077 RepID=A0ABS8PKE3_9BACT|nr:ABC transporter permease [Niabella pedocola]MCD2421345.1 ABC transporter permease [Niabella pedocola]